jgi:hypothetical protein
MDSLSSPDLKFMLPGEAPPIGTAYSAAPTNINFNHFPAFATIVAAGTDTELLFVPAATVTEPHKVAVSTGSKARSAELVVRVFVAKV